MKKLLILSLLLTLITKPSTQGRVARLKEAPEVFNLGGTLVIAIPTKDGLLLCGDNAISDGKGTLVKDDFVKVYQIEDKGVYSATGNFILQHNRNTFLHDETRIDFDLFAYLEKFFSYDFDFSQAASWNDLRESIVKSLYKMKPNILRAHFPPTPTNRHHVFRIAFFYLDNQQNIKGKIFNYTFNTKAMQFYSDVTSLSPEQFHSSLPIMMGVPEVADEIKSGTDKRFDDLRANKELRAFIAGTVPVSKLTAKKALKFSKYLIKLTSEKIALLQPNSRVSPTSDCALLSPKTGVTWLSQDRRKPPSTVKHHSFMTGSVSSF